MLSRSRAVALGIILGLGLFAIYILFNSQHINSAEELSKKALIRLASPKIVDISTVKVESAVDTSKSLPTVKESIDQKLATLPRIIDESPDDKLARKGRKDPLRVCTRLKKKFSVVPGSSWGSMTVEQQKLWTTLDCDQHLTSGDTATEPVLPTDTVTTTEPQSPDNKEQPATVPAANNAGLPELTDKKKAWCYQALEQYHVKPMKSWGSLPEKMISKWRDSQCDLVFTAVRMGKRSISSCLLANVSKLEEQPNLKSLTLISIMAATTTRKIDSPSTSSLALFTLLLPSLMRTLDCGFHYEYVLGYDAGDPFYDSQAGLTEVKRWFTSNIEQPLYQRGIVLTLRTVRVLNNLKKPGPVFIAMARAAFKGGAEYLYRINDDTELTQPWANSFIRTLKMVNNIGVVGPLCNQGNQQILTHDFVHRTHMEIFDMNYYPPELTDWWMDDWISWVYGQMRTFKARHVPVIHHTGAHGQRYTVEHSHEALLGELVKKGHGKIRNYLLKHQVSDEELKKFDRDTFAPGFTHRDIPRL